MSRTIWTTQRSASIYFYLLFSSIHSKQIQVCVIQSVSADQSEIILFWVADESSKYDLHPSLIREMCKLKMKFYSENDI